MRRKVKWIDRDRGWRRIEREVRRSRGKPHVQVGVFGVEAAKDHGGIPNVDVAAIHELGLDPRIPERSSIRGTVDERRKRITTAIRKSADLTLQGLLSMHAALERVGLYVQGQIRQRISTGIPPPNAPATVARKGSSTPLIDTGQLRASIDYEVKGT